MSIEFFSRYKHKIINIELLKKKIKKKKIGLCHGVFDVVHPGHIRHLAYARSKVDCLIVSITHDKHINKGIYRPHVPHQIRAANLAAFEMVDYVVIDDNPVSHNIIKKLRPNIFAKGFEYSKKNIKATEEEIKIVKSYGGKMLFTPGDVVYSSSKIIEFEKPSLKYEKLLVLMKSHKFNFSKLKKVVTNLKNMKVLILGDTIIDRLTYTNLIGGQTKTPTFSVTEKEKIDYLGGAGIVALHLKNAGADVEFITISGNDNYKNFIKKKITKEKIKLELYIDKTRPTTLKNVIINNNHRLLKIDTLDNKPIDKNIENKIKNKIKKFNGDAIIFSDFRHGIFNKNSILEFTKSINKNVLKVADSQVASRWGNITDFKNFELITPNEKEARFSLADQDSTVNSLTELLHESCNYKNIILKLGSIGVFAVDRNHKNSNFHKGFSLDSFANRVIDPVGSGDALLAYSSLVYIKTKDILISSIIGSLAAACACEVNGNIPVLKKDIINKLNEIEKNSTFR